jgi:hypothetical protein
MRLRVPDKFTGSSDNERLASVAVATAAAPTQEFTGSGSKVVVLYLTKSSVEGE